MSERRRLFFYTRQAGRRRENNLSRPVPLAIDPAFLKQKAGRCAPHGRHNRSLSVPPQCAKAPSKNERGARRAGPTFLKAPEAERDPPETKNRNDYRRDSGAGNPRENASGCGNTKYARRPVSRAHPFRKTRKKK